MNNKEIKEILDRIETASEIFDCLLKPEECTELLDFITNLQQENERLKELNAELKAITKRPTPIDYAMIQKRYEDYKSRCEKASEKINYYKYFISLTKPEEHMLNTLDNILQIGSDDNDLYI